MPSVSQKQQKAMGMAYAARKGRISPGKLKGAAKRLYESNMSTKQLSDYAHTKRVDLPREKVASLGKLILGMGKALGKGALGSGKVIGKTVMKHPGKALGTGVMGAMYAKPIKNTFKLKNIDSVVKKL